MSDSDCRNDCTLPLRFPRRPGTQQATIHGDGCPCCYRSTGVSQDNRPALSRFNYRIGSYGSIREFLFHEIDKTPELLNWTHRAPDDPAVALLEGASILGDVLTFYQEIYANEAYLRTARWRESISDLVRLLGYRLSPAVGGNAVFAFEIKKEEPVVIPAGFPVKATLEKLPDPANFETLDQLTAYPWLSRFNLYKPLVQKDIEHSTTEFYISKPEQLLFPVELKPGDRLLMGEIVDQKQLSEGDKKAAEAPEPTFGQIQAAESANDALAKTIGDALESAEKILLDAESAMSEQSSLIEALPQAAEIAASEAKMQAVNLAVSDLVSKAETAWQETNDYFLSSQTNGEIVIDKLDEFSTSASIRLSAADIDPTDRQHLVDALDDEAQEVTNATIPVIGKGYESELMSRQARWMIGNVDPGIDSVLELARKATGSEAASALADKAAIEAANKAVRLAAIAASSAAAGASDRVSAANLAGQANTSALTAVTDSAVVPGAIEDLVRKALALTFMALPATPAAAGTAALAVQASPDVDNVGLVVLLTGAAPVVGEIWRGALKDTRGKAAKVAADTRDVQTKIQLVVSALSQSGTNAAQQSVTDRRDAVNAISEAERLAGLANTAANTMKTDRAALIKAINDALPSAMEAKKHMSAAIKAVHYLIELLKKVSFEDIVEALMPSGGVKDEEENPTRLKNAEIVFVESIHEQHGRKIFKIKGELKRTSPVGRLAAFKLGRSFHHFGHNGPPTTTKTDEPSTSTATTETVNGKTTTTVKNPPLAETNIAFSRLLGGTTRNDRSAIDLPQNKDAARIVNPPLDKLQFPLDAEFPDIPTGITMLIETTLFGSANTAKSAHFTLVRRVKQSKAADVTWGLMTGSSSVITLDKPLIVSKGGVRYRIADIRDFLIHEAVTPLLTVKRKLEETTDTSGSTLNFYGTADEVRTLKGRRIMFEKAGEQGYLRNVSEIPFLFLLSTSRFKQLRRIRLNEPVDYNDFPNTEPKVTVFGNLADANEGKTELETPIGGGDAMQVFQNFKLPKAPLTYHLVPKNTPSETPGLSVFVNGREWRQVDSFFGRDKDEHIYIVRQDADGNSWVQFGDGKTGARLPNGVDNVTALYRTGDGAFGPLKEDTKVQASAKLKNLDQIQMPMDATGGAPPEDGESARNAAPAKVQSLGRIVSLKDYEAETIAIPGVVSARAMWRLHGGVPTVAVTVLMETGRSGEIATVENTLDRYDIERGAARNPVIVEGGSRMYVAVTVEYALDPTYRADLVEPHIRRALGVNYAKPNREEDQTGLFSVRRRKFGVREYASSIEGWVQNVDGVLWAKATTFMPLSDVDDPASIEIPGTTVANNEVTCDSFHILSLYDEHLTLTLRAREAG